MKKPKSLYVGKLHILNLKTKKVLCEGTGSFDVEKKRLELLVKNSDIHQNILWIPILETEDGYFAPAQVFSSDIVPIGFETSRRSSYGMSSYFNWPLAQGLEHIATDFDSVTIDVASLPQGTLVFNKEDHSAKVTVEGSQRDIETAKSKSINTSASLLYSTKGLSLNPAIRFKVSNVNKYESQEWLQVVHAFRLYWILQLDNINCRVINFYFGNELSLTTDLLEFSGYTDNTYAVQDAIHANEKLNVKLLASTLNFFSEAADGGKDLRKIESSLYRFMKIRFGKGTKYVGDEALDIIFSLDGFATTITKGIVSSQLNASKAKDSIKLILDYVADKKDELYKEVFDFYSQDVDKVYAMLSQKPFKESVRLCFEKLSIEHKLHNATINQLNTIRQTFVHGKGYNTQKMAKELYTHGTHDITNDKEGNTIQIVFGQKNGLVDDGYKMLRELYAAYFKQ